MPPRPTLPGQSAASVPGIGTDASLLLLVCKCPSLLPSGHYLSVHFASMTHTCTAVYTGHNPTLTHPLWKGEEMAQTCDIACSRQSHISTGSIIERVLALRLLSDCQLMSDELK